MQDPRQHALLRQVRVQALQGEQVLAALGRVGCPGVPRADGSRVAQQKTGTTIAAAADSVGVLSSLAAQASGQAQAVAYTLLVMRLFEPHRSAPHVHTSCALALSSRVCPRSSVRSSPDSHPRGVPAAATGRGNTIRSPFDDLPCAHTREQLPISQKA